MASGSVSPYTHPLPSFTIPGFVFPFASREHGVGNIPLPAIAESDDPICDFGLYVFVHFTPSMNVGVGNIIFAITVSKFGFGFGFSTTPGASNDADIAELLLGVGSIAAYLGSYFICDSRIPYFVPFSYPFAFALSLIFSGDSQVITAVGVIIMGDDEDPVAPVGSSDSRSRNKHRLDGISETLNVSADSFNGEGLVEFVSVKFVTLLE